jgi:NAD(P)-dependent dehydrogenase (short-subunit alcohol dehydrogenase family)
MHVKGKVAVVTGGASGMGLGLCTRFAREGAQVVLSDPSTGPPARDRQLNFLTRRSTAVMATSVIS